MILLCRIYRWREQYRNDKYRSTQGKSKRSKSIKRDGTMGISRAKTAVAASGRALIEAGTEATGCDLVTAAESALCSRFYFEVRGVGGSNTYTLILARPSSTARRPGQARVPDKYLLTSTALRAGVRSLGDRGMHHFNWTIPPLLDDLLESCGSELRITFVIESEVTDEIVPRAVPKLIQRDNIQFHSVGRPIPEDDLS
ncbi:hypothetical protein J6590_011287 [Homalodisca vitripennis]|nr:hypothetical protein J6590_011287 [Homalodisca vitripennis]